MKKLSFILLFLSLTAYSQELIKITESSGGIEMCGYTVSVDKIYSSENNLKADIYFSKGGKGKPFSGGYKRGDMIDLGDTCHWFLYAVEMQGASKGNVYISKNSPNLKTPVISGESLIMYRFEEYLIFNKPYYLKDVNLNFAEFTSDLNTSDGYGPDRFVLKFRDSLWLESGRYKFDNVLEEVSSNTNGVQHLTPAAAYFKRVYEDNPEYVIRKMKYYPKKKVDEEEYKNTPVKIYLLRITENPRYMATQVIEVNTSSGKKVYPYKVQKEFESVKEALQYAREHNILDINLDYTK